MKGAISTKTKGAAIAMPSSSAGMSIRLNFGWQCDISLLPASIDVSLKLDVVRNEPN